MEAEIAQSADAVAALLARRSEWGPAARAAVEDVHGVSLTARGSSDHAAAYGRYLLEQALAVPAWSTAPSSVTRYGTRLDQAQTLAIGVSQSGATPEICTVLEQAAKCGATTLAITNAADSPLGVLADVVIELCAGTELAVPSTKTFTASLVAFAALAAAVDRSGRLGLDDSMVEDLVAAVQATTADSATVDEAADLLFEAPFVVHFGRGPLLPLAHEAALKCIEATGVPHLAWSPVDFRHGPYALAKPGMHAVIQHAPGAVAEDSAALAADLIARGATVVSLGEDLPGVSARISVPGQLPEHLRPIVHAVRVQQLALGIARRRGVDPDRPPNLAKVTATE